MIGQGVSLSRLIGPCTPSVTATDAVSSALAPNRYSERLLSIRQEMTCANVFVASERARGNTTEEDVAEEKRPWEGAGWGWVAVRGWVVVGGVGEFDKSDYSQGLV